MRLLQNRRLVFAQRFGVTVGFKLPHRLGEQFVIGPADQPAFNPAPAIGIHQIALPIRSDKLGNGLGVLILFGPLAMLSPCAAP